MDPDVAPPSDIASCLGAVVTTIKKTTEHVPLCEFHAPKTSLGIILDEVRVALLRNWMNAESSNAAFATAHVGAGLSTLVRLLVRELRLEPIWIHAGTKHVPELLADAGASSIAANGRRKIIVVDEFDSVSADKRTMTAVMDYAKSGGKTKMLCAGHPSRSSKASEFAAKWTRFDFPRVSTRKIEATLRAAGFDPDVVRGVAADAKGDLRAAFNALELSSGGKTVAATKDDFVEGLDGVDIVLGLEPISVREALNMYAFDSSVVPMGVFENYTHCLDKNDIQLAVDVTEAFSLADVVNDVMYGTHNWDLADAHGVFSVASPALDLRKRTNSKEICAEKFGTVWSRVYNSKAKAKNARTINARRLDAGHQPMAVEDMSYQRNMIETSLAKGDGEIVDACGCLGENEVLLLMRLGFSSYKHARVKKLLS
jgi:hypothetical protein